MRFARVVVLVSFAAAAGCGGDDPPPDDASVIACVRETGARVDDGGTERPDDAIVPRGTRRLLMATWRDEATASVYRAEDADGAERAEDDLRRVARAFDLP